MKDTLREVAKPLEFVWMFDGSSVNVFRVHILLQRVSSAVRLCWRSLNLVCVCLYGGAFSASFVKGSMICITQLDYI